MTSPAPGAHLETRRAVERVVRDHAGRVLGGLIRTLGSFDLAEDAFQDAVTIAMERWPSDGIPENPAGWIAVAARRRALDRLRRRQTRATKRGELELVATLARLVDQDEPEGPDERLALIFTCCHPALAQEAQVALTLRTLGGLSTAEIARCFLVPEPTIAQRIVRAKAKIADARIPYRVPDRSELPERLPAALAVLYLVFNEGYSATRGPLVRADLCAEAIRLCRVLDELLPEEPETEGLLALMLLQDSRREARLDGAGALVTLDDQDRSRWDAARIAEGTERIDRALTRRRPGPYQLQAAIAALHAAAPTPQATDWWQITGLYAALFRLNPTPVVALNRAAALAMAAGPEHGLAALDAAEIAEPLDRYHLFHSARADLLRRLGRSAEAAVCYQRALALVENEGERRYLERRLGEVT